MDFEIGYWFMFAMVWIVMIVAEWLLCRYRSLCDTWAKTCELWRGLYLDQETVKEYYKERYERMVAIYGELPEYEERDDGDPKIEV